MFTKAYDSSPVLTQNLTEAKKLIQRAGTTGKTITIGVAAVVKVPYTATNQPHTLTITLVDEDGNGVSPFVPDGVPDPGPIRGELSFNLGRPAGLSPGEAQPYCLAANFNIGLRQLGGYIFELAIDGTKMKELSLRVAAAPPGMGLIQAGGSVAS